MTIQFKIKDKILSEYFDGIPVKELSKKYKCSKGSIYHILKEYDVSIPSTKEIRDEKIINMYINGVDIHTISKEMNVCLCVIYDVLKKNNVHLFKNKTKIEEDTIYLYKLGEKQINIAKKLGVSRQRINQILDKYGEINANNPLKWPEILRLMKEHEDEFTYILSHVPSMDKKDLNDSISVLEAAEIHNYQELIDFLEFAYEEELFY